VETIGVTKRVRIEVGQPRRVWVYLVGCGGTGSFAALHLARMAYHARDRYGMEVQLTLIDPDRVELKNVGRQCFCPAEVGEAKAWTLMRRLNAAFGLDAVARVGRFETGMVARSSFGGTARGLHVLVGAVDGPEGRRAMMDALGAEGPARRGQMWWVDGGNHDQAGQVLIGDRMDLAAPEVSGLGVCTGLPAPGVVCPELLEGAVLEEREVSCADLALADVQGLMVNQAVAGWLGVYVSRLVLSRDLDVWQTYLDLETGSVRSVGIAADGGNAR